MSALSDNDFARLNPVRRGHSRVAWVVIVAATTFVLWPPFSTKDDVSRERERIDFGLMELQGRYLVGWSEMFPMQADAAYEQALAWNHGAIGQRIRFAILAGQLKGNKTAHALLRVQSDDRNDGAGKVSTADERLTALVETLYAGIVEGRKAEEILSAEDREELKATLGWFGSLALSADGNHALAHAEALARARRTTTLLAGMFFAMALAGVVGFVLLVAGVGLFAGRRWQPAFRTGSLHGGIYAETFAIWMVLFIASSIGAHSVAIPSDSRLLASGSISLGSLLALAWPPMRGVPWDAVRDDLGLKAPACVFKEIGAGIACYLAALPLLALGAVTSLLLMQVQKYFAVPGDELLGPTTTPAHPLIGFLASADAWGIAQALFVAAVAAPLVEETMFRGVLFRHLREASSRFGSLPSFLCSGFAVSFVFAAIHPQGWTAIPILMSLAMGFTMAREWRGNLVGAMVAHGLNNAGITVVMVLATS